MLQAIGLQQMRKTTLEFCRIKPVRGVAFGPLIGSKLAQRDAWLAKVRALAGAD